MSDLRIPQNPGIGGLQEFTSAEAQFLQDFAATGGHNLQEVTDNGATTTNIITGKAQPTFTYTAGILTSINYDNGTTKVLVYNIDGTLDTLTITYPSTTPIVKTFNYSVGLLTSVSVI